MKNKKGNMLAITVVLIIALIALSIVVSLITGQQATTAVADDQFTALTSTCVRITDNCYTPNSVVVTNATSGDVATGNFSECGSAGVDFFGLSEAGGQYNSQTANATYTEQSCERLTGFTATIINNVPLLLAVALLVFVAGGIMIYKGGF